MKVIINEKESYELKLPDILSKEQFTKILGRLTQIENQLMENDVKIVSTIESPIKAIKKHFAKKKEQSEYTGYSSFDSRKKAVKFFNDFYSISDKYGNNGKAKKHKIAFAKDHNFINYNNMKVVMTKLKQKYNLKNNSLNR